MAHVIIRLSAKLDLEKIGDYIADDNPSRAVTFVDELEAACESLADFPERYAIDIEAGDDIRKMSYKGYLIFYRYEEPSDTVFVLSIMEGHKAY